MKDFKDNTRNRTDKEVIKRLLKQIIPYKKNFIISTLLLGVLIIIELLPPFVMGVLIDVISSTKYVEQRKILFVVIFGVAYLITILIANMISYIQNIILQKAGQQIVVVLRDEVFNHIENLSIAQINEVPVGKLVTRVTNDTNNISELYTSVVINLLRNILYLAAIIIILVVISFKMSLYLFAVIPFLILSSVIFRKYSKSAYRNIRNNVSNLNAFLSENLSGMKVTQIFNQEDKKIDEFVKQNKALRKSYIKEITVFGIYRPVIYGLSIIGLTMILYVGAKEVIAGVLTYGLLYSYYSYVQNFFEPIQELAEQFNTLQSAFSSAEKIYDVMDTKPHIVDEEDAVELESFNGHIEFKNVWFSYIQDEWVLKDVSFEVKPGETVAFVGATGSGKTTILSLIVRNYDIQKGEILLDGMNIKKIKIHSIRKHIGQMLQDVFLFSGTIKENITLKDENILEEEVIEAAQFVGANTFIEKLPDQYHHQVLERGNNFSSGQRQLISFARAVVYKPSLMILDEATANIDSETEHLIQESLEKMMNISTMLIVAHRLSTIQHSDKIIVMQKGEIKEVGNHQALLRHKGLYYHLYELQYKKKEY